MTRHILVAATMLFMGFVNISCEPKKLEGSSRPEMVTSNLIADVKIGTGVDLPKSCRFILSSNSARLDSEIWLFEIKSNDPARFPRQLDLQPQGDCQNMAKVMEREGDISIGAPTAWYFGIWQVSNSQCHATLIMTTNSEYLMLEKLY